MEGEKNILCEVPTMRTTFDIRTQNIRFPFHLLSLDTPLVSGKSKLISRDNNYFSILINVTYLKLKSRGRGM